MAHHTRCRPLTSTSAGRGSFASVGAGQRPGRQRRGPAIVNPDEVADLRELTVGLSINGRVTVRASTAAMVFGVPYLVSYLSRVVTLRPGDVIATGAPRSCPTPSPSSAGWPTPTWSRRPCPASVRYATPSSRRPATTTRARPGPGPYRAIEAIEESADDHHRLWSTHPDDVRRARDRSEGSWTAGRGEHREVVPAGLDAAGWAPARSGGGARRRSRGGSGRGTCRKAPIRSPRSSEVFDATERTR